MTRFLRRLAFVYLLAAVFILVLAVIETAVADAATGHATPVNFLDQVPVPYIAALIAANVVPYLSALATTKPGWWTGAITVALSLVDAVVAAVAHAGADDWRHVAAVTVGAWVVARLHLRTFLKGTKVETELHAHGYIGRHQAASPNTKG